MGWRKLAAKIHRVVFVAATIGAVLSCFIGMGEGFAATHAPMFSDTTKGLVVPINVHGTFVYISRTRALWMDGAWWVFGLCFLYVWPSIAYPKWRRWRDAGGTKI
jgi:hypothetical protein